MYYKRFFTALSFLILSSLFMIVPSIAQDVSTTLTGTIAMIYGDPMPNSDEQPILAVYLVSDDGESIALLDLDYAIAREFQGQRVEITTNLASINALNDQNYFAPIDIMNLQVIERLEVNALLGSQPWINLLCKFSDFPDEPKTPSEYQTMFSASYPGLDHYWQEISHGNIDIAGTQTLQQWVSMPNPHSDYILAPGNGANALDFDGLVNDCVDAADSLVDFSQFVGINLIFSGPLNGRGWGGQWSLTVDGPQRNFRVTWLPPWTHTHYYIAHEMGHGFNLPHSSGPSDNPPSGGGIYVSQWDVMSHGGTCALTEPSTGCIGVGTISYHLTINGWIPDEREVTVEDGSSQTITLERLNQPISNTNPLVAIVPIANSVDHFYTVEARFNDVGYDQNAPGSGIIIHDVLIGRPLDNTGDALVVDAPDGDGPAFFDVNDAGVMWTVGETYVDDTNNIAITVDSATATSFTVTISNNFVDISAPVTLFEDSNLRGASATFDEPGSYNLASDFNDEVSSIYLEDGWSVHVFEDTDEAGGYKCFTTSDYNLSNDTFNNGVSIDDNISSLVIYQQDYCDPIDIGLRNDDFFNAMSIDELPFVDMVDTDFATLADDPLPSCLSDIDATLWYSITPTTDTDMRFYTAGSDFDTTLSVWTGTRGNLTEIACNDDSHDQSQSQIDVSLSAGTTYYIMAAGTDGFLGPVGNLRFGASTDYTAPTGTIVNPEVGSSHLGPSINLQVDISNENEASSVQDVSYYYSTDGENIAGSIEWVREEPFDYDWDVSGLPDGLYYVGFYARDYAGNYNFAHLYDSWVPFYIGEDVNAIPIIEISPTPNDQDILEVTEGHSLTVNINVVDDDNVVIGFQIWDTDGIAMPPSSSLYSAVDNGNNTGEITFTPQFDDVANSPYEVTITALDTDSNIVTETFELVVNLNRQPEFPSPVPDQTMQVGETLTVTATAIDPDGDDVSYRLLGAVNRLDFVTWDSADMLTFSPTDSDDVGTYTIIVAASDGSLQRWEVFTLTVEEAPNEKPYFAPPPPDQVLNVGQTTLVTVNAVDPDGDDVSLRVIRGANLPSFITWDGVDTFTIAPRNRNHIGVYYLTVEASDGRLRKWHRFEVRVQANQQPVFTPIPDVWVGVGRTRTVTVMATDPEGQAITYRVIGAANLPDFVTWDGVDTFTIAPDSLNDRGSYRITVQASDGVTRRWERFNIRVVNPR